MQSSDISTIFETEFGANSTYVTELFRQYQQNPSAVDDAWRAYFASLLANGATVPATSQPASPTPTATVTNGASAVAPATESAAKPATATAEIPANKMAIRGPALKIVENMDASLTVPTATSQRQVQLKVLDENRTLLNRYLAQTGRKASYTHLVAWAIVKAIGKFPQMNDGFEEIEGVAYRVKREDVNIGIAIDLTKKDGSRTLLVPNIKASNKKTFLQFIDAYQDVVKRARDSKLQVSDFQDTTISLTNPGTIGTTASNPRLMKGQGAIIATGAIDYPPEYSAMTPKALSQLGISRAFTITSTYDHRIIQGAESGAFLAEIHELLMGKNNFFDEIFAELSIPYKPFRWSVDLNPMLLGGDRAQEEIKKQVHLFQLIYGHRIRGHLIADIDPLKMMPIQEHPELDITTYGITIWDLDREFFTDGLGGTERATLRQILDMLHRYYCSTVGYEYRHMISTAPKSWLQKRIESEPEPIPAEVRKRILWKLISSEQFERFLHTKYVGQKRFSIEGCDGAIPLLDQLIEGATARGINEFVIGMAHRGRLTVMANIGRFAERIFTAFEGTVHPNFPGDEGDVKYHQGATGLRQAAGREVRVTVASNPSHLEFVDPVVEGMVRAKQDALWVDKEAARDQVLPILIHGDAAFSGQGVVMETLNLADLKGYRTGGTIHIVINNQIGFTTTPESSRSSMYSTDIAKMTRCPIIHVNADDPDAAYRVLQMAIDFRQQFRRDIVIDLIGFRRHGHNEGDEPSYTQPLMYQKVKEHPGVRELYAQKLIREGVMTREEVDELIAKRVQGYEEIHASAKATVAKRNKPTKLKPPMPEDDGSEVVETGVSREILNEASKAMSLVPQDFNVNPKMVSQLTRRAKMGAGEVPIDWGFAEGLAFGSLLQDGTSVRLSGQDSGRGTFSQRHAILYDTHTGKSWTPLESLVKDGVRFEVFDSSLSEAGVLGYEYGYSVVATNTLTIWEAQFGDFANGAQVQIDQFIIAGEDKWQQPSRLVMLLPHGYEGQGPEHSSARLERFLQLCAENNIQVCYPTTPAQYFHLLRRQMKQDASKPLIVMTPKSLLRSPQAVSQIEEFTSSGFQSVIPDAVANAENIKRLVFCSGKVYYDLKAEAEQQGLGHVTILRVEQFYPFPKQAIEDWLAQFANATEIVWAQEEPQNMGGWTFMQPRLEALTGRRKVRYAGRSASASPSTGNYIIHGLEQAKLVKDALGIK
ncbi:MAG: multifunctional oxoglutarate decarboxylase/oxoglutarate dehydrogenase thiamine pyrophosphate-binding subunit/dihydrolipoyllysine-residue succinyltransferase subunit [Acidobacteria bacterium]|nr:multifunctional oxoglutarate decarboxylase/oxoglutarate dehydrogenase thiamine pyrophosphate-binding subunit/dihydrolipoyllysine-residue succinyltransferase subunit [Acidobacteriota bacterium]